MADGLSLQATYFGKEIQLIRKGRLLNAVFEYIHRLPVDHLSGEHCAADVIGIHLCRHGHAGHLSVVSKALGRLVAGFFIGHYIRTLRRNIVTALLIIQLCFNPGDSRYDSCHHNCLSW
uniref:Uncharacterized protein n=1 Tax=Pseudoalteromonas rubra TaxID=43658 RepID=A0A0F4QJJ0_9GAMM|nr:hypothetical protein TW77_15370 [Pseudoalteromonas rubra]